MRLLKCTHSVHVKATMDRPKQLCRETGAVSAYFTHALLRHKEMEEEDNPDQIFDAYEYGVSKFHSWLKVSSRV